MANGVRIVFLGTAPFAVPALEVCCALGDVVGVVTQPDKPGSRGTAAPRPVADVARAHALDLAQPLKLRDPEAMDWVLSRTPDVLVVAAYGQIVPAALLDGCRLGGINVHASLLPRWRGAAPIARAILAGDPTTGVTLMQMDAGLDTGAIISTVPLALDGTATTPVVTRELAQMGASALGGLLQQAPAQGRYPSTPQLHEGVMVAPRIQKEEGSFDLAASDAHHIERAIRALQPWPGVTIELAGLRVRLEEGDVVEPLGLEGDLRPGSPIGVSGDGLVLACATGWFRALSVRPAGGGTMTGAAFARGRLGKMPKVTIA